MHKEPSTTIPFMEQVLLLCQQASARQWMDSWAKSWGIATTTIRRGGFDSEGNVPADLHDVQHFHPIFYDPASHSWKASEIQLDVSWQEAGDKPLFFLIFQPPIDLHRYFSSTVFCVWKDTLLVRICVGTQVVMRMTCIVERWAWRGHNDLPASE